jgi:AraC-like DNA-binding protein
VPLTILRAGLRLVRSGQKIFAPRQSRLFREAYGVAAWFEPLIAEAFAPVAWSGPRTRGLLLAFFTELARLDAGGPVPAGCLTPVQRTVLIRHVVANPAERPTPRELAAVAGLSADYFARCFQRTFRQSPRRWLVEKRIRHGAQHLLETERRVGEVAREFGYADVILSAGNSRR